MPVSCMCHVRGGEHVCRYRACATFESESMQLLLSYMCHVRVGEHACRCHACATFEAESMQCMCPVHGGEHACFVMHKQAMALAVLPTTMVHPSLLLGLRGRLRSMPLHSHACGHVTVYGGEHACCCHACGHVTVYGGEHACRCHACGTFESESMHAAVMHVPSLRGEHACRCHACATFEAESIHCEHSLLLSYMCPI
jgi:hypothetical protein